MEAQPYAPAPWVSHHVLYPEPVEEFIVPLDQENPTVLFAGGDIGFQEPQGRKGLHGPLGEPAYLLLYIVLADVIEELKSKIQAPKVQRVQMAGFQHFAKGYLVPLGGVPLHRTMSDGFKIEAVLCPLPDQKKTVSISCQKPFIGRGSQDIDPGGLKIE